MEDDDDPPPPKTYPLSPAKMSKVPSWISLGFVFGALVAWTLHPKPKPNANPPPVRPPPPELVGPKTPLPTQLTTIEAVFAAWGQYAVWDGDTTEIVFWNAGTQDFTETYEVRRSGEAFWFRSIPKPTAPLIDGARLPKDCPLRFVDMEKYRAGAPAVPAKKTANSFAPPMVPALNKEEVGEIRDKSYSAEITSTHSPAYRPPPVPPASGDLPSANPPAIPSSK